MKRLLIIFAVIGMGMLMTQPIFVFSQEGSVGGNKEEIEDLNTKIEAKRAKIKELEKNIEAYKEKISSAQTEKVSLRNQLAFLDNRVAKIRLDIEATQEKLDTIELEIERLDLSIAEKERVVERQKVMIAEFVRTIHQQQDRNFITILAAYESFSDFYNRIQYLEKVDRDLGKSVRALKDAKTDLEEKKEQSELRQEAYQTTFDELEEKQTDLEEQLLSKETLLAQTHASELTYKTLVSNLQSQYRQIENEISSIEQEVRKRLEEEDKLDDLPEIEDSGLLSWPTASRYVTAYFNDPSYPYRYVFEHNAIDIRAAHGTPLRAAASGYVGRAKHCSASTCYSYVMLIHSGGISTVYGHMSSITVSADQFVSRGDIIGYSGGTPGTVGAGPFVTGPHLHFEVRKNGIPVNPLQYLVKDY